MLAHGILWILKPNTRLVYKWLPTGVWQMPFCAVSLGPKAFQPVVLVPSGTPELCPSGWGGSSPWEDFTRYSKVTHLEDLDHVTISGHGFWLVCPGAQFISPSWEKQAPLASHPTEKKTDSGQRCEALV